MSGQGGGVRKGGSGIFRNEGLLKMEGGGGVVEIGGS